jgi:outer membrane protein assembly factor BamB
VEAFDAASGKPLWGFQYASTYEDEFGFDDGPRSMPTVADGVVYTYGAQGMLHALDLATGKKLWHADLQEWYGAKKGFFGTGCSPLVVNGRVHVIVGGKSFGIGAFDAKTGKLKWGATKHEASYSSPVEAPFGLVFFTRRGLVVTDRESGKVTYEMPWRSRGATSVNAATPVIDGNLVFVSASYGVGAAVLDFSTNPPTRLWANDDTLSAHYATPVLGSTGSMAWRRPGKNCARWR